MQNIINFLETKADFTLQVIHNRMDEIMQIIGIEYMISKQDKVQAANVNGNIYIIKNGEILVGHKVVAENGRYSLYELTTKSLNELEASLR